jgi:transcriptional antiterminator RfaH
MPYWYALHAKPHKERQVEAFLTARGIQVYFPTVSVPPRRGRPNFRAFFPRYLFARTDIEQVGLWTLHHAPGMTGVVMFGGTPARVDDTVIEALQQRLARVDPTTGARDVVVDDRGEIIEPGDRVAIKSGPLAEFEAVFDRRLSATGRVRVLIHLLKHWASLELDVGLLQKASGLPRRDLARPSSLR